MKAELYARKFKIEHDVNEYTYFVTWTMTEHGDKWVIELGSTGLSMQKNTLFGIGNDMMFNTAQEAFDYWKNYIEEKKAREKPCSVS